MKTNRHKYIPFSEQSSCAIVCHCLKCKREYICRAVHLNGRHDGDYLCRDCTDKFLHWVGTLPGRERIIASAKKWIVAGMGSKGGKTSRRVLTMEQARKMVEAREAKKKDVKD